MTDTRSMTARLRGLVRQLGHRGGARLGAPDRGDVPGWVLITLMTAGLVTVLWALAGDQLQTMFTQAMASVTGPR
ncbi:hypothetical protein [Oryzihumus leptocrescens]|uniref:Uncharacterized protein n=1 Tax=Oryzihumus leptocrescens TaxID=297536 RepID=A0A542ZH01_9MICO|nr:hypothetical protein [Oryzihumus leptocrescens]TQL59470.1 hypothetical protein FB474_0824 [Oryzihumus leptocrescens]